MQQNIQKKDSREKTDLKAGIKVGTDEARGKQEMQQPVNGQEREHKNKALKAALAQIEQRFGKGTVMRFGDRRIEAVPVISTGSIGLDAALGIGGLPRGRIVEVFGPESSGKTTIALQLISEAQKLGGTAAFVDAEHALDPVYAEQLGVHVEDLLLSQPDNGEQALEVADVLLRSGGVDVLIVDSVAALVPKAEIEGEMGDQHVGLQARLMSHAMRKLTGNIKRGGAVVLFTNQIRIKIGAPGYGIPETTPGGNALKFYSSVRLDVRRIGAVREGEEMIGNQTRVKVVKNKMSPPFRKAEFQILYGHGINHTGELVDLGVQEKLITQSGSWYSYGDQKIGQGRTKACDFLDENPKLAKTLEDELRKRLLPSPPSSVETAQVAEAAASS